MTTPVQYTDQHLIPRTAEQAWRLGQADLIYPQVGRYTRELRWISSHHEDVRKHLVKTFGKQSHEVEAYNAFAEKHDANTGPSFWEYIWALTAHLQVPAEVVNAKRPVFGLFWREQAAVEWIWPNAFTGQPVCPEYPKLPYLYGARISKGMTPKAIADSIQRGLTSKEAHLWLLDGMNPEKPSEWLGNRLLMPLGVSTVVRTMQVARWLQRELHRRTNEDGTLKTARRADREALEHIDVVDPQDLRGEGGTSILAVVNRAMVRKALESAKVGRGPRLPWRGPLLPGVTHLRTGEAMVMEGIRMSHCVGSYAGTMARGEGFYLSLRYGRRRSTVELSPSGRVVQHKAKANATPVAALSKLLNLQLRIWRLQGKPLAVVLARGPVQPSKEV